MNTVFTNFIRHQKWPPLNFALVFVCAMLFFTHFGFYHWLIKAGIMFVVFWLRPNREFFAWYAINTLCSVITAYKNLILRGQSDLPFLGLWPSAELFTIGTMLFPLLIFLAVQNLKHKKVRVDTANSFYGMSHLLGTGLIVGLFLTLKDIAYVLVDGKISEVKAGMITQTQHLGFSNAIEVLGSFVISHFIGAFLGVMIVAPVIMWWSVAEFRAGSARTLRSACLYLLPVSAVIGWALFQSHQSYFFGLVQVLLMAAVVVFTFYHGWRGAVAAIVLVSIMVTLDNHFDANASDPKQMQLFIAIVGSVALMFGVAIDELKNKERTLLVQQQDLQQAAIQKQHLLNQFIDASRRSMQAQDVERQRIAHELHDEIGQSIAAMHVQLNQLQIELHQQGKAVLANRLLGLNERISEGVRSVVMDLAPVEIQEMGLYMALAHGSFSKIAKQANIDYQINFHGDIEQLENLDTSSKLAVYRIVQESLTNIIKHAHASRCVVLLRIAQRAQEYVVFISVQDDGVGLNSRVKIDHLFNSMRDRITALNGKLHVRSRYGLRIHALIRQKNR